jgi:hypothetical protein
MIMMSHNKCYSLIFDINLSAEKMEPTDRNMSIKNNRYYSNIASLRYKGKFGNCNLKNQLNLLNFLWKTAGLHQAKLLFISFCAFKFILD